METWLEDPSAMSRAALPWVFPTSFRPKSCLPQNHTCMRNCLYLIMWRRKHFVAVNCELLWFMFLLIVYVFCFATSKVHDVHFNKKKNSARGLRDTIFFSNQQYCFNSVVAYTANSIQIAYLMYPSLLPSFVFSFVSSDELVCLLLSLDEINWHYLLLFLICFL